MLNRKSYFKSFFNYIDLTAFSCGLAWGIYFLDLIKSNEGDNQIAIEAINNSPFANLGIVLYGMIVIGRLTDIFYMFKGTRTYF